MINVSRDLGALGTIALTKRIRSDSHRSSLGVCAHACMSREVSIHCYFNSFVFLAFTKKQYVSSICHLDYYQELIHSCSIFFCVFREFNCDTVCEELIRTDALFITRTAYIRVVLSCTCTITDARRTRERESMPS